MKNVPNILTTALCIWLLSTVAMSNGSFAPEQPLLENAKRTNEYPILKHLQELTLELQLLELSIKNRHDEKLEGKIAEAIKLISNESDALRGQFRKLHDEQVSEVNSLLNLARRYGSLIGVSDSGWNELASSLEKGQSNNTALPITLSVRTKSGLLNVVKLTPVYVDRNAVWKISIPSRDQKNYWIKARGEAKTQGRKDIKEITITALTKRLEKAATQHTQAAELTAEFHRRAHHLLYNAVAEHRFGILHRISLARQALVDLGKSEGAMGTPEEYGQLFNQLLENLFSYGVNISLAGEVKGFLFGENPIEARALIQRLKYSPSSASYNSPSS